MAGALDLGQSPGPSCRTSLKLQRLGSSDPRRGLLPVGRMSSAEKHSSRPPIPGSGRLQGICTFFPRESVSFIREGGVDMRCRQRPLGGAESLGC